MLKDGLYIQYEITEITIPFSKDDLLKFTMEFGKILTILNIYDSWCFKQTTTQKGKKRLSMDDDLFGCLINSTVNRKRECITKHFKH